MKRRLSLAVLLTVAVSAVGFTSRAWYRDWRSEASHRERAAERRRISELCARIDAAERYLSSHGAKFKEGKGISVRWTDLSEWQGSHGELEKITEFALLEDLHHPEGSSLHIRLGPRIGDKHFAVLTALPNLVSLDIHNSNVTAEAITKCKRVHPHIRFQSIEDDFW